MNNNIEYNSRKVWQKVSKNIRIYANGRYRAVWGKHQSLRTGWAFGWNLEELSEVGIWLPIDSLGRHRTLYLLDEAIKKINGLI